MGVIGLVLVGCSEGGGAGDAAPSGTTKVELTSTSAPSAPSTTASTTTTTARDLGDGNLEFETPSGNIGCHIDPQQAICDIDQHTYPVPPAPSDCPLQYGPTVTVRPGAAGSFACVGGVAYVEGPVLEYGQAVRAGPIECRSAVEGLTCTTDDGHGFFQSRDAYRFW